MKLTGPEIKRLVESKQIVIDPFDAKQLNPNSYNLRLGPELLVYDTCPRIAERSDMDLALRIFTDDRRARQHRAGLGIQEAERHLETSPDWRGILDMAVSNPVYRLTIPPSGVVLVPGRLYLGHTVEYTETPGFVPCIDGRSSIGRLGISIHATAGFGDVGYCGTWTLEINVVEPVRIYAGVEFCQISYEPVQGEVVPYCSAKYQGEREPRPSGIWKEFQSNDRA